MILLSVVVYSTKRPPPLVARSGAPSAVPETSLTVADFGEWALLACFGILILLSIRIIFRSRKDRVPAQSAPSGPSLIRSLQDLNPDERRRAAIELHQYPGDATVEALIKALKDNEPEVRACAAESLRLLGDTRAVNPLIQILESDTKHNPVHFAILALGRLRTPKAIAALVFALERGKGDHLGTIASQLGEARAADGVDVLIKLLGTGSDYPRRHAVVALEKIGDKRAIEPLKRALEDPDEGVRERAAEALLELGYDVPTPAAAVMPSVQGSSPMPESELDLFMAKVGRKDMLDDSHWTGILRHGARAIPRLLPLLDSADVNVVAEAAGLLGRLEAREAVAKLKVLATSQCAEIRNSSLAALARLAPELRLDENEPYQQIASLWTALIQQQQNDVCPSETLRDWCAQATSAMPRLNIPSAKTAQAWAMLGDLYYKALHPDREGGFRAMKRCPEAKRCFQEAVRLDSGQYYWNEKLKRLG